MRNAILLAKRLGPVKQLTVANFSATDIRSPFLACARYLSSPDKFGLSYFEIILFLHPVDIYKAHRWRRWSTLWLSGFVSFATFRVTLTESMSKSHRTNEWKVTTKTLLTSHQPSFVSLFIQLMLTTMILRV